MEGKKNISHQLSFTSLALCAPQVHSEECPKLKLMTLSLQLATYWQTSENARVQAEIEVLM